MDVARELARLGFRNVEIEAFEESRRRARRAPSRWRFPWTVIAARKAT